jgi:hypothetical protein
MRYWRVNEARDGGNGKPIPSTWTSWAFAAVLGLDIGLAVLLAFHYCPPLAVLLCPFLILLYPWKLH